MCVHEEMATQWNIEIDRHLKTPNKNVHLQDKQVCVYENEHVTIWKAHSHLFQTTLVAVTARTWSLLASLTYNFKLKQKQKQQQQLSSKSADGDDDGATFHPILSTQIGTTTTTTTAATKTICKIKNGASAGDVKNDWKQVIFIGDCDIDIFNRCCMACKCISKLSCVGENLSLMTIAWWQSRKLMRRNK